MFSARGIFLVGLIFASLITLYFIAPISQDLAYHNFADKRYFFGIPNFFDVATNLAFLIVGIMGLTHCFNNREKNISLGWIILFLSILLVSFGSSYYHYNPTNSTLTWDRLPMAIGFMAIFALILGDYVHPKFESTLLMPMVVLGMASVIYWHFSDDLRLYAWVQFCSLGILIFVISLYKPKTFNTKLVVYAFIFYVSSKVAEFFDESIYQLSSSIISGHSIKHLLAGIGLYFLYLILKTRKIDPTN